jgi:hypothetical protein
MRFARIVFLVAGSFGLLALAPLYFLEDRIGRDLPPAITHPEFFYGFTGVALAWQVVFLVIASDPSRYRPLMLIGVLEKLGFGVPVLVLFARGRCPAPILGSGITDLILGALFVAAWVVTKRR